MKKRYETTEKEINEINFYKRIISINNNLSLVFKINDKFDYCSYFIKNKDEKSFKTKRIIKRDKIQNIIDFFLYDIDTKNDTIIDCIRIENYQASVKMSDDINKLVRFTIKSGERFVNAFRTLKIKSITDTINTVKTLIKT